MFSFVTINKIMRIKATDDPQSVSRSYTHKNEVWIRESK